jgi:hypothetical protein
MFFDVFHIHQRGEGYTLKVDITRPSNAPRHRVTNADRERNLSVDKKNQELAERVFTSLGEVLEEIKHLSINF